MLLGMRKGKEYDFALERERGGREGSGWNKWGDRVGLMGMHLEGGLNGPLRGDRPTI